MLTPPETFERDETARHFQPGRLWSLFAMLKLDASAFISAFASLSELASIVDRSDDDGMKPLTPAHASLVSKQVSYLREALRTLEAEVTDMRAQTLETELEYGMSRQSISAGIKDIQGRLQDELSLRHVFVMQTDLVPYYNGAGVYTPELFEEFNDTLRDMDEAGKCLALKRNTACVYHLMLTMERVLRVLADKIGVDLLNKKGDIEKWSVLVGRIKEKIPSLPPDKQDDWTGAHNLLWGVGKAWRNDTMHPADSYTDEEAKALFDAVKGFMRHLATLI